MYRQQFGLLVILLTLASGGRWVQADEWPQWRGPQRDGQWREEGLLEQFADEELEHRWSVEIGSGYSGPVVADGRVFVTDRLVQPEQIERVHCFRWTSGELLWSHEYDCPYVGVSYEAGPRASVLVDRERAYSLGAMGHLHCFDVQNGDVLWKRDLNKEYHIRMPNWGIAAAPLIEEDLIILQIGGEQACVVALDKLSGEERWKALDDEASYSAPIAIDQGEQRVVVVWTGERIVGLDPRKGSLFWEHPFKYEHWPIAIATPVRHQDQLVMSEAHQGTLVLKTRTDELDVEKVWKRRDKDSDEDDALHCLISTPYVRDDHIYGADNTGILRCLDLSSGQQHWMDDSAVPTNRWAAIHLIPNGQRTWLFNERGELMIGRLDPEGYHEISRAKLLEPTTEQLRRRGGVTWSHPAFAYRHVFARNDKRLVCADLSADGKNAK